MKIFNDLEVGDDFYFIFYDEKEYHLNAYKMRIHKIRAEDEHLVFYLEEHEKQSELKIELDFFQCQSSMITDFSLSSDLIRYYGADNQAVYNELYEIKKNVIQKSENLIHQIDNKMDLFY